MEMYHVQGEREMVNPCMRSECVQCGYHPDHAIMKGRKAMLATLLQNVCTCSSTQVFITGNGGAKRESHRSSALTQPCLIGIGECAVQKMRRTQRCK